MSAVPATPVRTPSVRRSPEQQVISGLPQLALVPTPAPAKGFISTVIVCLALFFGAFATVFYLNTQMVATAYEIQNVNRLINAAAATNETLTDEVVQVSTPEGLRAKASSLGMVPATDTRFLDLENGDVVIPADPKAVFQAPPVAPVPAETDATTGAEATATDATTDPEVAVVEGGAADAATLDAVGDAAVAGESTEEAGAGEAAVGTDGSAITGESGAAYSTEPGVSESESGVTETATETQGY
ncbi:MAG: hypothetical protein QM705_04765 [Ancrocorticia sp.]